MSDVIRAEGRDTTYETALELHEAIMHSAQAAAILRMLRRGRNVTDMHPVDEFICSECGLILRDLTETRIDEENEDECYFEFECKYCPRCGARMDGNKE